MNEKQSNVSQDTPNTGEPSSVSEGRRQRKEKQSKVSPDTQNTRESKVSFVITDPDDQVTDSEDKHSGSYADVCGRCFCQRQSSMEDNKSSHPHTKECRDSHEEGNRDSQRNKRDGFHDKRGGFHDNRGGFHDNRSGHYDSRGGFHDNRGGFHNNRGGFQNSRGGFHDNRGGHHDSRGQRGHSRGSGRYDRYRGERDDRDYHDNRYQPGGYNRRQDDNYRGRGEGWGQGQRFRGSQRDQLSGEYQRSFSDPKTRSGSLLSDGELSDSGRASSYNVPNRGKDHHYRGRTGGKVTPKSPASPVTGEAGSRSGAERSGEGTEKGSDGWTEVEHRHSTHRHLDDSSHWGRGRRYHDDRQRHHSDGGTRGRDSKGQGRDWSDRGSGRSHPQREV